MRFRIQTYDEMDDLAALDIRCKTGRECDQALALLKEYLKPDPVEKGMTMAKVCELLQAARSNKKVVCIKLLRECFLMSDGSYMGLLEAKSTVEAHWDDKR